MVKRAAANLNNTHKTKKEKKHLQQEKENIRKTIPSLKEKIHFFLTHSQVPKNISFRQKKKTKKCCAKRNEKKERKGLSATLRTQQQLSVENVSGAKKMTNMFQSINQSLFLSMYRHAIHAVYQSEKIKETFNYITQTRCVISLPHYPSNHSQNT